MKPTYLFAMISLAFAAPKASAMSELEKLRARCGEQESQIRRLENENARLRGVKTDQVSMTAKTQAALSAVKSDDSDSSAYIVRKGDSIERIARKNGCSAEKLAKANGLKSDSIIQPGQKLKMPGASSGKKPSTAPLVDKPAEANSSKTVAGKTHKLEEGETYSTISRKYGVSVDSLIAANPEASPTKLRGGQIIRIPANKKEMAKKDDAPASKQKPDAPVASASEISHAKPQSGPVTKPKPAPSQASHKSLGGNTIPVSMTRNAPTDPEQSAEAHDVSEEGSARQPAASPNPEKKIRSVKIEGEMTYGEFAAKHGTDTGRLNDLNGLDLTNATVLAKGSELYVPAQP